MDKTLLFNTMPVIFPVPSYLATAVDSEASAAVSIQTTTMLPEAGGVTEMLQLPPDIEAELPLNTPLTANLTVPVVLDVPEIRKAKCQQVVLIFPPKVELASTVTSALAPSQSASLTST